MGTPMGLAVPPLFICLWFTGPRGRVCHPHAHSSAADSSRSRWGPDAPTKGAGRMPRPGVRDGTVRLKAT